jgi:hypothetical protein
MVKVIKMNKSKSLIFGVVAILLLSTFAVAVDLAAATRGGNSANVSNRLLSASWVRLNGNIDQWGTTDVRGQLQTQVRAAVFNSSDSRQFAGATAIWTANMSRPIQGVRAKENFTYVFYAARLTNASVSTVNVSSASSTYFINGTWNFAMVTSTVKVITNENGTITRVLRSQDIAPQQIYGELTITGNTFALTLTGQEPLTGTVYRSIARTWFNPYQMNPDAANNVVTRTDVKSIAQCYNSMPGWGNYDISMDFNGNYRVDIADISTVAAQI